MALIVGVSATTQANTVPVALTLRQLIDTAQQGNKNLQAARFVVAISQARLLAAGVRESTLGYFRSQ